MEIKRIERESRAARWARRHPVRSRLEVGLTGLAAAWVPCWPRAGVVGLARLLGAIGYRMSGRLRALGDANLELALGAELSAADRARVLRQAFRTMALTALDTFWFARRTSARLARWVAFDGWYEREIFQPGGAICLTAHMGNWELFGKAITYRGFPLMSVVNPLANPAVDVVLNGLRQRGGQLIIERQGAMRRMLTQLRQGGKIAVVLDQNTLPDEGGVLVDFFGRTVCMSAAPAALHYHTGAPVRFGVFLPDASGQYRARPGCQISLPPCPAGKADPETLQRATQAIASAIEATVRADPGQWLWMYKRWKYIPPAADPATYPDYAQPLEPGPAQEPPPLP
ncbi:MAG: hypothetical protein K9N49_03590 [Candidatus Marinimicrobia bacterium]|nr:hypothetical protein [Candidatus Neomarinimicrobiota bacterium]